MTQAKEILYSILNAHCLTTQNTNRVYKLSGIKANIYNGKRDYWQIRKTLLRAISDEKAKDIINQMPFPFIETANGHYIDDNALKVYQKHKNNLVPLEIKIGYRMESNSGFGEVITRR